MIAIAPRDLALLLTITLAWGLNLIVSKVGVQEMPPLLFTALRMAIVAVLLAPLLRVRSGQMSALAVASVLGGGLHLGLSMAGLRIAENVSSVAIASQLSIPFTTLLCVALLGETVRWRRWTGILLAFSGVFIMGFDPQIGSRWQSLALVIAGAFVGSLGTIAVKKLSGFKPLELQAWFACMSLPILLVLSIQLEQPDLAGLADVTWRGWGALAYTALIASMFAHTVYFHLLQRYPVTSVAPLSTLAPVFSVIFGVTLLGDQLSARIIIGGACTLIGVLIIMLRERRIVDIGT
ncbi:MAG TPA: DMT family transporter [Steroidobacteraceae bacterium]